MNNSPGRYRIRKVGKTWRLFHVHREVAFGGPVCEYEHQELESSYWEWPMWLATEDPAYRQPGWMLVPRLGGCSGKTW